MADLEGLIKLRKHAVDEKQRALAKLYRDAENLQRQRDNIVEQMENEKRLAAEMGSIDATAALGKYLEGARRKVQAFDMAIKKIETRIAAAQDDMREAFADQKKIEITQRERNTRAAKAQARKEDNEMDEVALEGYRRREEDDG